jgi:hypothetical protein
MPGPAAQLFENRRSGRVFPWKPVTGGGARPLLAHLLAKPDTELSRAIREANRPQVAR